MKVKQCIVNGCTNKTDEGNFVGTLCFPCHEIITTGNVIPTKSFIGDMKKKLDSYESKAHNIRQLAKNIIKTT